MIFGTDALGVLHYEKELMRSHPKGWCAGMFLRTFGDALPVLERMAKSGKFSEIVVHLAPFDYNHKYLPAKYEKKVLADAVKVEKIARETETLILISPYCEHNHKKSYMEKLFDKLDKIAPTCMLVNSIWKGDEVPGTITEIHLVDSKPVKKPKNHDYIIAFDGFGGDGKGDFWDADIPKIIARYPDARQIRWWNFELNGKYGHKDKTPIPDRKNNWPSEGYLRTGYANLKQRVGNLTWGNNKLYKIADDHDGAQKKDNKAMCILPINKTEVKVFDTAGNVIDKMSTLGLPPHTGTPKGNRFYSSKFTYQLGDIAQKNTGSRLIRIHDSPLTDSDLRSGLFK